MAKFAAAGKGTAKKDLGAIARSYGNVYVAQVSMGANDLQTTKALLEADAWPGPSLVIAYSTCIAHGIDMSKSMSHQKDAVKSGYWPLYRFHPSEIEGGKPFKLDSSTPSIPIADFVATETRFAVLQRTHPERAAELATLAQADADERWHYYEQLAGIERTVPARPSTRPQHRAGGRKRRGLSVRGRRRRVMTVDLRTRYLGLELRSPIVASAAPHNADPVMAQRLERAGVGAIVLPSLFEEEILAEEIELSRSLEQGTEDFAEALDYFPAVQSFAGTADRYLTALERVKAAVAVPVIASLNASTVGGWVTPCAAHPGRRSGRARTEPVPRRRGPAAVRRARWRQRDLDLIAAVRASITIPLAVKLSPFYSAFANFAAAAVGAGADGLVLFNRFYQPDLDLESIEVVPRLELSQPWEMRLPVRWIAILRPQLDPDVSLAATSGAHSGDRRGQGPHGRRRRRDDDLGPAPARPGARRLGRGGAQGLDGRTRVQVRRSSCAEARARRQSRTRQRSSAPTTWRRSTRGLRPRSDDQPTIGLGTHRCRPAGGSAATLVAAEHGGSLAGAASGCCFRHLDQSTGSHVIDVPVDGDTGRHERMVSNPSDIVDNAARLVGDCQPVNIGTLG